MSKLLTVYVNDDTENLENVQIDIYNNDLDTLITSGLTNINGQLILSLPEDQIYNLFMFKSGYSFPILPKEIELTEDLIVSFTANKLPEVTAPTGYVKLYGELKELDGNPFVAQLVKIQLSKTPQTKQNVVFSKFIDSTLTDENGYFYFLIPGTLHVTVTIPSCNFMQSGLLPYNGQLEYTKLGL